MKKLLLGLVGIAILAIGCMNVFHNEVTDRYNPLVKEDWLYVKAKESGRVSTVGEAKQAGDFKLSGYYGSGAQREIKFYAPRGLKEGTYVRVKTKGEYVETFEEVQVNNVPKDIKEKLDK
ncbi:YxeA family protein [Bacillus mycoides]|uniref:YxeA family protein n=1 Tax=Bacillus mycoides TaxID=1405 RepID=UPI003D208EE4